MSDFIDAFSFIGDNGQLMVDKVVTHLEVSAISVLIAVAIGVPIGVWLGHLHRFSFLAINLSNIGRALPSLGVLAILLPFIGIGETAVVIALVVLAFPPILTNSYVAVDQVEPEVVDAAKGIGLRPMQVVSKVELPLALPLIFAGIRTSAVFVVATATLGGIFGGGGLGDIINDRESYGLQGIIAASYLLIVMAFVSQALFIGLERLITPAGMKSARGTDSAARARRQAKLQGRSEETPTPATSQAN